MDDIWSKCWDPKGLNLRSLDEMGIYLDPQALQLMDFTGA